MNQHIAITLLSALDALEDRYRKHAQDCRKIPAPRAIRSDDPEHWESQITEVRQARDYVLAARKGEAA